MKNTFFTKVDAERRVLKVVNSYTKGLRQLSGLSWPAIDVWSRQNGLLDSDKVLGQLKSLSDLCQRLSDRSHETFQALDESLSDGVSRGIEDLEAGLNGVFSK